MTNKQATAIRKIEELVANAVRIGVDEDQIDEAVSRGKTRSAPETPIVKPLTKPVRKITLPDD